MADEIVEETFPKNPLADFELFKQNFKKIEQSITAEDVRKWNVEYCKRIENESENLFEGFEDSPLFKPLPSDNENDF